MIDTTNESDVIQFLENCNEMYFNTDQTLIPDAEYDELYLFAKRSWPSNSFFDKIGATVRGFEIQHSTPIGGLEQIHTGELAKWLPRLNKTNEFLISEKLDGSSLTLSYDKNGKLKSAYTRGDGITGADVTRHAINLSIPQSHPELANLEIRGEFIIKKQNFDAIKTVLFETLKKTYKNLRGIANGLINSKEIPLSVFPYLDFVAYEVNRDEDQSSNFKFLSNHFIVPASEIVEQISEEILNAKISNMRGNSLYEIDGIVVEVNSKIIRAQLGKHASTFEPKYAFKWKMRAEDNIAKARVITVEWNQSRHAYLKPTVVIESTDLCGCTISRLSGFNMKFISENGIGPNALIEFTRAGDVIPHILKVMESVTPELPTVEWKWNETKVDAVAVVESFEQTLLKMKHFFNTLEVEQVQDATLDTLFSSQYDTIEKILVMSESDWCVQIGKNGIKAYESLHQKLKAVEFWELIAAWPEFGRGFGKRRAKALQDAVGLDQMFLLTIEKISQVPGFQEKTAKVYLDNLKSFEKFYTFLCSNNLIKLKETKKEVIADNAEYFVFTKYRDKQAEVKLKALGHVIQSDVNKNTTFLVVKDLSLSSSKTEKAKKQGIKIIDPQGLEDFLKTK